MNRKSKSPAVPPSNDVTPYYSVESVESPLRTDRADPTVYLSALSATPQPSPVHQQTKRSLASASTSTERPIKLITLESGAQTTSSINVLTQPGADFAMQTSDSLEDRDKSPTTPAQIAKHSRGDDVESSITEPSVDRAETNSSASQVHAYDNSEPDLAKVTRVKKLTKPRYKISSPPSVESSFIAPRPYANRQIPKEERSSTEEASLESQAFREQKLPTIGSYIYRADDPYSNRYDKRMSGPVPTSNYRDDPNELGMHDSDNVNQQAQNQVTRAGSSTSTLSSEPYLEAAYSTNLQLGDGFLYMIIPPDGGYGWFVMVVSFFCQLIVDGIIFSVGILLPYIADDFDVSQTAIALVISVQVGPVASAVINKYSYRIVALVGATCSVIFILIGTFSPNVGTLIFFYSLLAGPSLSLVWVSSQLIIGYYFERHRPIANGIACSGAGAGIFLFSIMNAQICPKIGWRNTSRIHSALLLLVIFMGITFIEVTPTRIATVKKDDKSSSSSDERTSIHLNQIRYSRYQRSTTVTPTNSDRGLEQMIEEYKRKRTRKIERLCPCCFPAQKVRKKSDETTRSSDSDLDVPPSAQPKKFIVRMDPIEREDLFYTGPVNYDSEQQVSSTRTTTHVIDIDHRRAKTVNYSLSVIRSQRHYQPTKRRTISELRNRHKFPLLAYISPFNWMPEKLLNAFAKLFDTNLLKITEFRILLLSAFFYPMGFNIPFVFAKMRAQVDPFHANLIPATIGLSNFVFRIASGFAADKFPAQTTYVCGGGIIFGGVATFVSAFYGADIIWFQFTFAACYGVAPAFYSALRAIIYVRTLGLDKLTNAFGLTGVAMGLGVFLGTSTAAILNSLTNSYCAAFAFSGICLIMAGVLKIILPTVIRFRAKRLTHP